MQMLLSMRSCHTQVKGKNKVKHERAQVKSLKRQFPSMIGLDTTLDCVELIKETI